MYPPLTLLKKYLLYRTTAANSKGHGVHSPFVFEFITRLLNDRRKPEVFDTIEALRREMKRNRRVLNIEDFGAGSVATSSKQRTVSSIARTALKPPKYGQLMHRMINHYMATRVVELGTSLGITTSYMALSNPLTKVYTLEGSDEIANIAQANFEKLGLANTRLIRGNFDDTLAPLLEKLTHIDLAFVDGNHRREPTIRYFEMLLAKANDHSVFVFDDIHWSREMEEAWHYIRHHQAVTLSIDLFHIGIVFFRKEQKVRQHFVVKY